MIITLTKKPLLITAIVILGLGLFLSYVNYCSAWPDAENPPHQGEALDPSAFHNGVIAHSAKALAQLVREPQNTWSNIAYIFGGAVLISFGATRCGRFAGAMLVAVGVGSFLYHASASRTLRHADVAAMYGLYFSALIPGLCAIWPPMRRKLEKHMSLIAAAALFFAVGAACGRNLVIFGFKPLALTLVTAVVAAFLITSLILVAKRGRRPKTAGLVAVAILLFVISVVCQVGDRPGGWLCDPEASMQGHALWHLFSATAFVVTVLLLEQSGHERVSLPNLYKGN